MLSFAASETINSTGNEGSEGKRLGIFIRKGKLMTHINSEFLLNIIAVTLRTSMNSKAVPHSVENKH